jgi:hypothetical protein
MDISTDSDNDDHVGVDTAISTWTARPASGQAGGRIASTTVPGLNLGSISVAPQPARAYRSERVECLQPAADDATPPWRAPRQRHVSDPGDGVTRKSVYQSMPTFRDFLGAAPLSESGVYQHMPPAPTTQSPALQQPQAPAAKQPDVKRTSANIAASASGTQLTFRDLLPPLNSTGRPTSASGTPPSGPTPISAVTKAAFHAPPSRYPSGTDASTDYDSAPSTSRMRGTSFDEPISQAVLFDEDAVAAAADAGPGSPCMSCHSPVAPGSVLRSDGGILEAPDSAELMHSSMSPPSMTPPPEVREARFPSATKPRSPPKLDTTLPGSMLPGFCAPIPEHSEYVATDQQLGCIGERYSTSDNQLDKENGSYQISQGGQQCQKLQPVCHEWKGSVQPLRCITRAYAQQQDDAPADKASTEAACAPLEPSAWRARHFRGLTPNTYITDDLICEAIEAARRCAPAGDLRRAARRQSFHARPLTPEDLQPLECCSRPASAPPGTDGSDHGGLVDSRAVAASQAQSGRNSSPPMTAGETQAQAAAGELSSRDLDKCAFS